jgi:antitoxin ParD1/3/4
MAQMNISIPEGLKSWAEKRVADGRYASTSDYVRDLMRRDEESETKLAKLRDMIARGRASGVSDRTVEDIIADYTAQRG